MVSEKTKNLDDFTEEDKVTGSDFVFWDRKDSVIGLFKCWTSDNFGEHAVLQTEDAIELHLPNLTALNGKLRTAEVKEGDKVKVVALGEVKSKKSGRTYEDFDVFVKHN